MNRSFTVKLAAAALALLGGVAQAAPITPGKLQWTYNFSPGSPSVISDTSASAYVQLTNEPTKAAVGTSDIVATNLRVFSAATAAAPDVLSTNGAYALTLVLSTIDDGTPYSTSMTFDGKLTGTFSAESANVGNVFGPNATQTVSLGSYTFTVSMVAYTPPGPPDQLNAGSLAAHVTISRAGPAEGDSPEPSTMLLSALGLSCLGGAAWRKRRQGRVAAA
ncbi:MAG: PEP-CTERM sorting domain-containing protein [Gemmataceae bacterium]